MGGIGGSPYLIKRSKVGRFGNAHDQPPIHQHLSKNFWRGLYTIPLGSYLCNQSVMQGAVMQTVDLVWWFPLLSRANVGQQDGDVQQDCNMDEMSRLFS